MLSAFNITQTGQHHLSSCGPCQDYSFSGIITCGDKEVVLAAAADGLGSCKCSHIASETAVMECVDVIERRLNGETICKDCSVTDVIREAFEAALAKVKVEAERIQEPIIQFDTTLTCAVFDGANLWFGHVGDDGIVAMYQSGEYELITSRHKGSEYNSVVPLRQKNSWQFGKAKEDVASFVIMTDGLLDRCVDSDAMGNRVYLPFLSPVLTAAPETIEEVDDLRRDWEEFLYGDGEYPINIRDYVMDDITIVAVINGDRVKLIDNISFDNEKWDMETEKRDAELEKCLHVTWSFTDSACPEKEISVMSSGNASSLSATEATDGGTPWNTQVSREYTNLLKKLAVVARVKCSGLKAVLIKWRKSTAKPS